ncbi:archease [Candidatus Pacearchaeota archaeon]|nr:archease [Candidatus Pacearchaeota archaeon]
MKKFKFLEHTADIKFQAFGKNIEEAFENSALAMFTSMFEGKVNKKKSFKINVKGKDFENLLYNFLEELLFLFDSEKFFLANIKNIKIDKENFKLDAEVFGDDTENYEIHLDVKAITYNEMFVKEKKDNWVTQVVLDV